MTKKVFLRPRRSSPWPLVALLSVGFILGLHIMDTSRSPQVQHSTQASLHLTASATLHTTTHITTTTTCPPLSKDLLSSISTNQHHNTIMLALVSSNQLPFAHNWFLSSTETDMAPFTLLGATDPIAAKQLASWSIPCFTFSTSTINTLYPSGIGAIHWGDDRWRDLTWQKVFLAATALQWGHDLIISDVDVVWLRNPLVFFNKYSAADILIGHDGVGTLLERDTNRHLHNSDGSGSGETDDDDDDGDDFDILEPHASVEMNINTGLYFIRSNNNTRLLLNTWAKSYEKYHNQYNDQTALYELLRREYVPADTPNCPLHHHQDTTTTSSTTATDGLFCCFKGRIVMGVVPTILFANGHSYAVSELYKQWGEVSQPYAVHWTWTYGGETGKMMRMKEMMQWRSDPDEYYSGSSNTDNNDDTALTALPPPAITTTPEPKNGFIQLKLKMPDNLPDTYNGWGSNRNEEMITYHLTELQRQLEQIYVGLALASATGRILILPRLVCYCEYIWHPGIRCRLPDAQKMDFPITCPADYVFELDAMREESGVEVREWSFLENQRVPDEIKMSHITLKPVYSASDGELSITKREEGSTSVVGEYPASLHDQQVLPLLHNHGIKDYKIWTIDFSNTARYWDVYKGYACPTMAEELERRLANVVKRWCCRFKEAAEKLGKTEFVNMKLVATPSRKLQPLYKSDTDNPYCLIGNNS